MDKDRSIIAQVAYKCASWLHAAEVQSGASPDTDHLFNLARSIANGIVKLGGPSTAEAGGSAPPSRPRAGEVLGSTPSSPAPSCPRCNEPMEFNPKWTGTDTKPKWRCSMRGKFIDRKWTGCDGARWEDREGVA